MGAFWECRTCFEQHSELRDAERCCANRMAALEERAAIVAYLRIKRGAMQHISDDLASAIEAGDHLK